MIVCYAQGGGLGHLTRLRAYLHTVGERGPVTVLTASPFAVDLRVTAGWAVCAPPSGLPAAALRDWVSARLRELAPRELVVDAFPAGLRGELDAAVVPAGTPVTHLARLLRWEEAYAPLLPERPLRFGRTFLVEPVGHGAALAGLSDEVAPLALAEPPCPEPPAVPGWLVVHSGPDEETLDLVAYARETARLEGAAVPLTVVSPRRPAGLPDGVGHRDVYPAWPLFAAADRVVTAAGCNAVRQLAPWRERHRAVPFPRRFDDQFARARRITRPSSAGASP